MARFIIKKSRVQAEGTWDESLAICLRRGIVTSSTKRTLIELSKLEIIYISAIHIYWSVTLCFAMIIEFKELSTINKDPILGRLVSTVNSHLHFAIRVLYNHRRGMQKRTIEFKDFVTFCVARSRFAHRHPGGSWRVELVHWGCCKLSRVADKGVGA